MKYFFYLCAILLALGGLLGAGGCRAHHPDATPNPRAEGTDLHGHRPLHAEPYAAKADSPVHRVAQKKPFLGIFSSKKPHSSTESKILAGAEMPRKCKGCTIVYGTATVAGKKATVAAGEGAAVVQAGKKATAVAADSGASVQVATAKQQATAGQGNSPTVTTTKKGLLDYAVPALGILGGVGLVYWLVAGGGLVVLAGWFRRKKDTANS